MRPHSRVFRAGAVVLLLALGLGVQLYFFSRYPQPIVFGDPVHYLEEGQRWHRAFAEWRRGDGIGRAWETLRPGLLFSGVAMLFGTLDALRPHDWAFFRVVLAGFNTIGMLAAFVLAYRLSGSFGAGLAALAIAAFHPSFATHTPRLYPDPVTGCLFAWAAAAYVSGVQLQSRRWMTAAGVFLMLALFVRSQLMNYVLLLLAVIAIASAHFWARRPEARRLVAALAIGLAPFALAWLVLQNVVGKSGEGLHGHLGLDMKQAYPYGFWQYLETDGWEGPFRLRSFPFYKALEAEARASDPDLLVSRPRQLVFTARYVAARWWESLLLVADNAYRLYDRPANPYQWDYPFPLRYQPLYQKAILLLSACALAAFAARAPALAGAFFIPLTLAVLHGLAFPWPRYGFPAYLTHIGAAGAFLGWLLSQRAAIGGVLRTSRRLRVLVAGAVVLLAVGFALADVAPEAARVTRLAGTLAALGTPFAVIAAVAGTRRGAVLGAGAWLAVACLVTAHELRDRRWHETLTHFDARTIGAEQEIRLMPDALARLRTASEAFVVFDLHVPGGDPKGLAVEVGPARMTDSAVMPTMPRLREATATGRRDRRAYPQWWAVRLTADLLPASPAEPLRIRIRAPLHAGITLAADRFRAQQRRYEGPSFGDWPRFVAGKIEYDSDYRIGASLPLESAATRSFVVDATGQRRPIRGVHRIRVITLDQNEGGLTWETAPAPGAGTMAIVFAAYSGDRGHAELHLDGRRRVTFPLGAADDYDIDVDPYRLCFLGEGLRGDKAYGRYVLIGPPSPAAMPQSLAVAFRTGMSLEPRYFQLDARRTLTELSPRLSECRLPAGTTVVHGVQRVVDATRNNYPEDTGRWMVKAVY